MKKFLIIFFITLGLTKITNAQGVITAVPCDMLGMVINVGSQETSISIYHSGQYMTHPQSENIFMWEFRDQQGNILHQDTIIDQQTIAFGHNWSLTDTINVIVHFVNDSANLDNWYISQGLSPNGNLINCLFEDQLYWKIDTFPSGTPYGMWTFIHNTPGVDLNLTLDSNWHCYQSAGCQWAGSNPSFTGQYVSLSDCQAACNLTSINNLGNTEKKLLVKIIDFLGRKSKGVKNQPLFYIYDDGTVEKKIIFE
tara:strand:+ start:221 stop:979 length:759 start_codon:yes stop_codon:yes gene_type:complete